MKKLLQKHQRAFTPNFQGDKIQASVQKTIVKNNGLLLNRHPSWSYIRNFDLTSANNAIMTNRHQFQIVFTNDTVVFGAPPLSNSLFFDFADFKEIVDGTINPSYLIDLIGQVVCVGVLTTRANMKMMRIILHNPTGFGIICSLWGKHAESLHHALNNNSDIRKILVLRFAQIIKGRGLISVSSTTFPGFQFMLNPNIPEVHGFILG